MFKLIIIIAVAVAAYFVLLDAGVITHGEATESTEAQAEEVQTETTKSETTQEQTSSSPRRKSTADSVVEYGTGYTQWKAKEHGKKKLENIQAERNQDISEQ